MSLAFSSVANRRRGGSSHAPLKQRPPPRASELSLVMNESTTVLSAPLAGLRDKIRSRQATTGVIGLGYVGLPLLLEYARCGYRAIGFDIDLEKVRRVNAGDSYVQDVAASELRAAVQDTARLRATGDFAALAECDTVNICVPTPLRKTKDPDISYIVAAVREIAPRLHPGMLVILESTTYPGTTDEVLLPILQDQTGLVAGKDFSLAFSPERVDPGNPRFNTKNIPKVVGGLTPQCTALAAELYEQSLSTVVRVSNTRVAETVKLLENTFRSVNIGLVNEIALMCDKMGIDVWEVIEAAATKPFGFMPFYPGPGLGGHCIPIDPFYLSWKARLAGFEARFIELAGQINGSMPAYVVDKVASALNDDRKAVNGSRVLVLGLAYKADVDDVRESPALDIVRLLQARGAVVAVHDPYVRDLSHEGLDVPWVDLDSKTIAAQDCVVVVTAHGAVDWAAVLRHAAKIVDTRNVFKGKTSDKIVRI
jgi:UDP-N-acetyl-D-glucosamine dehydrogenase